MYLIINPACWHSQVLKHKNHLMVEVTNALAGNSADKANISTLAASRLLCRFKVGVPLHDFTFRSFTEEWLV